MKKFMRTCARVLYIIGGMLGKGDERNCSEKTSVYFEHKGTLIFQTYKIRI